MINKIKSFIYGGIIAIGATVSIWLYMAGKRAQKNEQEIDDYEHAEDIRRRVSVDRADELRKHDQSGWRD